MAQRQWRSDDTDAWLHGFGNGSTGSTYAVPSNEGCSGTATTTAVTLAAAGTFSDGDLVLIHQTRGTGVGTWELNKIASGGGTTSLTMAHALMNTYTDSGASQAQMIEMNQYDGLTTGAIATPEWDGSKGGILAWFDKGTSTINGTLDVAGDNASGATGGTGVGFNGGDGRYPNNGGYCGEGSVAATSVKSTTNGNGAGGGPNDDGNGGGGGNGATGGTGTGNIGAGGLEDGNASLTDMVFGGGGGGGSEYTSSFSGGGGGGGGGICLVFASNIVITGSINLNGGAGTALSSTDPGCGGGGAGGSCLLKCETATLGTNLITASGGARGAGGNRYGGTGAVGRIHIDYSGSYTGTTTPTINATNDVTIVPVSASGGAWFMFM